jgi:hypothetical protein
MAIEQKIRSAGHKSLTYSWLRRYVVIGPYNRRVRHDVAEALAVIMVSTAARNAVALRQRRAKDKQG